MTIVSLIIEKKYTDAYRLIEERIAQISDIKLAEHKKMLAANFFDDENLSEEFLEEGPRIKIIKARIRNGKIQRRKKVSNVAGFTIRGGKMVRMSVTERRNRRMGQRRGKIKRKAKAARALMKRKRSILKRKRLGI